MKIDASRVLVSLGGEDYTDADGKKLTLGGVLAESLATTTEGGKMKTYTLAQRCYAGGEVEVDAADMALIKKATEACKSYNNLVVGQALALLEEAK